MKKNRIGKRVLAVTAAAVSSFLLLSGFDSSMTVDDLIGKAQEASGTITALEADVTGTADISLDVSMGGETQSIPLKGDMAIKVTLIKEPFAYYVGGTLSGDASEMGISEEGAMDMYMVAEEDGTGTAYVNISGFGEEGGWQAAKISAEDMENMTTMFQTAMSGDNAYITEQTGIDVEALQQLVYDGATVSSEPVNVNGKDCYEISQTISGETIGNVLSQLAASSEELGLDDGTLSMVQMLSGSLQIDVVGDYDAETFLPAYASIDLAGSDFTMIAQLVGSLMFTSSEEGEESPEVNVTVNALNMQMTYNDAPESIEIPAEALAAPVEETELDLGMLEEAG